MSIVEYSLPPIQFYRRGILSLAALIAADIHDEEQITTRSLSKDTLRVYEALVTSIAEQN